MRLIGIALKILGLCVLVVAANSNGIRNGTDKKFRAKKGTLDSIAKKGFEDSSVESFDFRQLLELWDPREVAKFWKKGSNEPDISVHCRANVEKFLQGAVNGEIWALRSKFEIFKKTDNEIN